MVWGQFGRVCVWGGRGGRWEGERCVGGGGGVHLSVAHFVFVCGNNRGVAFIINALGEGDKFSSHAKRGRLRFLKSGNGYTVCAFYSY